MSTSALKKDHNSTLFKCKFIQRKQKRIFSSYVRGKDRYHDVGSGSLSSPMQEHRNFAQFYCISVTNFSTVSECILLEIIWIKKNVFFRILMVVFMFACNVPQKIASWFSTGCICRLSGADHAFRDLNENSLSARWQSDTHCTQQYVVSLDQKLNADSSGVNAVVNFKPQNALKCLKYPPIKWSWIRTLSNEVWG